MLMAESPNSPSVSVALTRILKNYAERLGMDFAMIAGGAGVDAAILADERARISARQFELMWQQIYSGCEDPHPGLSFGRELVRHYPGGSVLFTMMINCATIGDALDAFVRYHRIMADAIQPRMRRDGGRVRLSWKASPRGFPEHPVLAEALICAYHFILKHLSQGEINPIAVCFTHDGAEDMVPYRRLFKAPITFGAEQNELIVDSAVMDIKILMASRELYNVLENHAARISDSIGKAEEWSNKVIRVISRMVMKGIKPTIDSVSKELALSKRSLQTNLKRERTTFRKCLENVRQQTARDYLLRPDVSLCDVAFLLGYSEQSAFNHAFKRWTGKSPQDYRSTYSGRREPRT